MLPDGHLAYAIRGEVRVHDVQTGQVQKRGAIPSAEWSQAMAADDGGNLYVATAQNNLYRFDPSGRRVATLNAGRLTAGAHAFDWDAPAELGAGVYLYRAAGERGAAGGKLVLLP